MFFINGEFGTKTRLVCLLVGQYLFPTTKLTCFYVLPLLKSLNNIIIQILNLTIKLTLKTNPNAQKKKCPKLYHVSLVVGNKYPLTKKHTSLVSMQKSSFMKKVYTELQKTEKNVDVSKGASCSRHTTSNHGSQLRSRTRRKTLEAPERPTRTSILI